MTRRNLEELRELVRLLGELRDAMPETDPCYGEITRLYREASNFAEKAVGIAIDAADKSYVDFTKAMPEAMQSLRNAIKKTEEIAKTIEKVAKVIGIVGKILTKIG